jgi:hypothetical protein
MDHREYLAQIGRKGGRAGKGTELRRELNRRASLIRWGKLNELNDMKQPKKRTQKKL